ncbi:hypothetical protein CHUAL_007722 [Chamberlinius hualienensis]
MKVIQLIFAIQIVNQLDAFSIARHERAVNNEKSCATSSGQAGVCADILKCDFSNPMLNRGDEPLQTPIEDVKTFDDGDCGSVGSAKYICCTTNSASAPQETSKTVVQSPESTDSQPQPISPSGTLAPQPITTVILPQPTLTQPPSPSIPQTNTCTTGCGKLKPLRENVKVFYVVGGKDVPFGHFSWMVALFLNEDFSRATCGGTLISDQWVLTAGHCFFNEDTNQRHGEVEYTVRLGVVDLDSSSQQNLKVIELILHPSFSQKTKLNDIALMKLETKVTCENMVGAICLPSLPELMSDTFEGKMSYIAGWGEESYEGKSSSRLKQLQLKVIPNNRCQEIYDSKKSEGIIINTQLCAGLQDSQPLTPGGPCQGDSGGPLMYEYTDNSTRRWYVVGVVSFGIGCADIEPKVPAVFTRVTSYIPWIMSSIKNVQ